MINLFLIGHKVTFRIPYQSVVHNRIDVLIRLTANAASKAHTAALNARKGASEANQSIIDAEQSGLTLGQSTIT